MIRIVRALSFLLITHFASTECSLSLQHHTAFVAVCQLPTDRGQSTNPGSCSMERIFTRRAAIFGPIPVLSILWSPHRSLATVENEAGLDKQLLKGNYDRYSRNYEDLDGGPLAAALGINSARAEMLSRARGNVLEVGIGTGLNLPGYRFEGSQPGGAVTSVSGIDLSDGMLSQARSKATGLGLKDDQLKLSVMDVERLQFPDETFDTVVDTYSLCVFTNPVAALREMRRVCKKRGSILLLENAVSEVGPVASYQKATAPLVARFGGKGCFYDQDPAALARAAGMDVTLEQPFAGGFLRRIEARP